MDEEDDKDDEASFLPLRRNVGCYDWGVHPDDTPPSGPFAPRPRQLGDPLAM